MRTFKSVNRSSRVNRSRLGTVGLFLFMIIFGIIMAMPLALIISNAFKPQDELWVFPPRLIPNNPTLENFRNMFNVMSSSWVPFFRYLFNTVLITVTGSVGHVIISSMCAFPLAKKKFPGRNIIFKVILLLKMKGLAKKILKSK